MSSRFPNSRKPTKSLLAVLPLGLLVAACGGGSTSGGSGVVTSPPPPPQAVFANFDSVVANNTTRINGRSTEAAFTSSGSGENLVFNSVSGVDRGSAIARISIDNNQDLSSLSIDGRQSDVSFNEGDAGVASNLGSLGYPGAITLQSSDMRSMAIYADPYFSNFNYQTFGVWATGLGTGSGNLGAISVGAATDGTRIPPTGSVVFTGYVAGILTQDGENAAEVVADASFSTNFETRTIEVEATNSQLSNAVGSLTPNDAALLDFTGTLTYGGGGNTITGIFSTSPTLNLSGEAAGQFFGPDANEIGGTFFLTNPDDSMSYIGGFGGN